MRQDQVPLQRGEVGFADPRFGELPEAGVHTIDRAALGNRPRNDGVAVVDPAPRRVTEADRDRLVRDATKRREPDLAGDNVETRVAHARPFIFLGFTAAGFAAGRYICTDRSSPHRPLRLAHHLVAAAEAVALARIDEEAPRAVRLSDQVRRARSRHGTFSSMRI